MYRSMDEIFSSIVLARPEIKVENVHTNGDVVFLVGLGDLGLMIADLNHPILSKRFFVNFVGELLVRRHIAKFADILTGLEPKLYNKIILSCRHTDFGMIVDEHRRIVRFQMHLSLVQEITTENFTDKSEDDADEWDAVESSSTGTIEENV